MLCLDSLFILVDIDGAKTNWTPSDEGNPARNYVSQYVVVYDTRYTGYSSCDKYSDGYHCCCKHERQNHSVGCNQESVGFVDLKDYYFGCMDPAGNLQSACTMTAAGCPTTAAPTAAPLESPLTNAAPAPAPAAMQIMQQRAQMRPKQLNGTSDADVPCGWDWGKSYSFSITGSPPS